MSTDQLLLKSDPDCDARPVEEVANGRIPTSEIIPPEDKKDKSIAYPPDAFEMDGGQSPSAKQG
jgi:hypothetical protein